jgi:hypothetical protein
MSGPKVKELNEAASAKPRLIPVSVAGYPEEVEAWKRKAEKDSRPLSSWLRLRLLAADARDEEMAVRMSERQDG